MDQLSIRLFGHPEVMLKEAAVAIEQRKAMALLAYLALSARPHRRTALAGLLWPNLAPAQALANVRHTLWVLRAAGLAGWLIGDRTTLALRSGYWLDVAAFEAAQAAGLFTDAAALYRGDLLAEFTLPDAPSFDAWLTSERDRCREAFVALQAHVSSASPQPAEMFIRNRLPQPATSFIGRDDELEHLQGLLERPDCRLITLTGPGGIGKTRLALELVSRIQSSFHVAFVTLQGASHVQHVAPAIAEALGLVLQGPEAPWLQLAAALSNQELLLVLDNCEHLLDMGEHLSTLLQAVPRLRLLVTSREPLRLQEEWLFPLEGLAVPPQDNLDLAAATSAVQLFIERAQQVQRDAIAPAEYADVVRICHLVSGLPLAIELAATWRATLSCAEIAGEIAHNLTFLEANLRNLPERHRSMQVVFDQSWAHLAPDERTALMRLAVFRGGFTRTAAEQVAEAQISLLARLVDRSLLRRDQQGRYHFHELMRQYAEQQLRAHAGAAGAIEAACADYFAQFLQQQFEQLTAGNQLAATAAIAAEHENIRNVWPLVVRQVSGEVLRQAAKALSIFYFFRGPYQEGKDAVQLAIDAVCVTGDVPEAHSIMASLLTELGWFDIRTGQLTDADLHFTQSAALFAACDMRLPTGRATDPAIGLGLLALIRGDYATAGQCADQVHARGETQGLPGNLPFAWYIRTEVALAQGQIVAAHAAARAALAAARRVGDDWFSAYALMQLGQIAAAEGRYAEAEQHFQESYTIREAFGDLQGMALALVNRGMVALQNGAPAAAAELYERSRAIYLRIGDQGGLSTALAGLGAAACAIGSYARAQAHLRAALETAWRMEYLKNVLHILTNIADLLRAAGRAVLALELLALVIDHPACTSDIRDQAGDLVRRCEAHLPRATSAGAVERGRQQQLDTLVDRLLIDLTMPLAVGAPAQSLPEQLTERELQILGMAAEGLSNREIAQRLFLSVGTVKWYTGQIYSKLGVETRMQAVSRARQLLLLS